MLAFAAVPAAATTVTAVKGNPVRYRVTAASGSESVRFSGTPNAGCVAANTCGMQGTATYSFGGTPKNGRARLLVNRSRVVGGSASFGTSGATKARVTSTSTGPGQSAPCSDEVVHHHDSFSFASTADPKLVRFDVRDGSGKPDYLKTGCPGPTESDLAGLAALPSANYSAAGLNHAADNFSLKGSHNFSDAGFEGVVTWKLAYTIQRGG